MSRLLLISYFVGAIVTHAMADLPVNVQPIGSEEELRTWLENMIWKHKFNKEEVTAATGLSSEAVDAAIRKYDIRLDNSPVETPADRIVVLPQTGGRFAFLNRYASPQHWIIVSVFSPWQPEDRSQASYLDVELDQIIFNCGLTTETTDKAQRTAPAQKIERPRKMWKELPNGELQITQHIFETGEERITAQANIKPHEKHVIIDIAFTNETTGTLTLSPPSPISPRWIHGVNKISKHDVIQQTPYRAIPDVIENRWIITAWNWSNRMSSCGPGDTRTVKGLISFYEGKDVRNELERLDASKWAEPAKSE